MKILVTGGCGYKGSVLIPKLLGLGYKILSIDTQWFGNYLPKHKNLTNIKLNVNNINEINLKGISVIIHLASIANDPMADLDENLSWETSALGTYKLVETALKYNVKKIIYASSGSVYGIKKEKKVHEGLGLDPITDYNKSKMICEKVIQSYSDKIKYTIIRPATVCGFSDRLRLDVVLNLFCYQAYYKKKYQLLEDHKLGP